MNGTSMGRVASSINVVKQRLLVVFDMLNIGTEKYVGIVTLDILYV